MPGPLEKHHFDVCRSMGRSMAHFPQYETKCRPGSGLECHQHCRVIHMHISRDGRGWPQLCPQLCPASEVGPIHFGSAASFAVAVFCFSSGTGPFAFVPLIAYWRFAFGLACAPHRTTRGWPMSKLRVRVALSPTRTRRSGRVHTLPPTPQPKSKRRSGISLIGELELAVKQCMLLARERPECGGEPRFNNTGTCASWRNDCAIGPGRPNALLIPGPNGPKRPECRGALCYRTAMNKQADPPATTAVHGSGGGRGGENTGRWLATT